MTLPYILSYGVHVIPDLKQPGPCLTPPSARMPQTGIAVALCYNAR